MKRLSSFSTYRNALEQRLKENGWTVAERRESDLWWIAETWLIRSTWHPEEAELFLNFLVDPQSPSGVPAESVVWAVAASSKLPLDPLPQHQWPAVLPLGRRWERGLDAFLGKLSALRGTAHRAG